MSDSIEGQRQSANPGPRGLRHDAIVPEAGHDPYRLAAHFPDPTVCRTCGALYRTGRWQWPETKGWAPAEARERTCPACQRVAADYPAGFLTLSGAYLLQHRADVLAAVRAEERLEAAEHPLHRVISFEERPDTITMTTTDVHLPRRIARALEDAFAGESEMSYGPEDETVRVAWRRSDDHVPAAASAPPTLAVEILTNGADVPPDAETYLHERIARLRRFYPRLAACRVVLEAPPAHQRTGGAFHAAVHVEVPGSDIHVTRQQAEHLHAAIRFAFNAAERQLEDHIRKQRGDVSPTVAPPRARVIRLFPESGYGFLRAADGHELYFHRNSVLDDAFARLTIGAEVRYAEEAGNEGPQASTVVLLE